MPRNNSVDIAKGMGILLVVLGHNWILTHEKNLIFQVIYSFHMPLFFFLGGIFLNSAQSFPALLRTKADSLLKPYAVVLILLGLYKISVARTTPGQYFPGVLYGVGTTLEWSQLWFLPSLFVTLVFAWMLLNILRDESHREVGLTAIIAALFLLGATTINAYSDIPSASSPLLSGIFGAEVHLHGLPLSLDVLPVSAAFLLLGHLLRKQIQEAIFRPTHLLTATLIFIASHLLFSYPTDLNLRIYGNWLLTPIRALSGIYMVLSLSTLIAGYKLAAQPLAYLGKCSLFILIFHAYVEWGVFEKLAMRFEYSRHVIGAVTFVGGVALPIVLFEISKRVAPMSLLLLHRPQRGAAADMDATKA